MREFMAVAKALADENRVRVLMFLHGRELCVCQIIEMLGLAPSTVSKHMAVLHRARLVEARKDGRWIYYRLPDSDAPPYVLSAVGWVHGALARDRQTVADARRLRTVLKRDRKALCRHYRS